MPGPSGAPRQPACTTMDQTCRKREALEQRAVHDQDHDRPERGDDEAVEIDSVHARHAEAAEQPATGDCAADAAPRGREEPCTLSHRRLRCDSARMHSQNTLPLNLPCRKPYF